MQSHFGQADVARLIDTLADRVRRDFAPESPINIVGIRTRGETLAQRLTAALAHRGFSQIARGVVDITLYRDDLSEVGPGPLIRPTQLNITVDGVPMILVDDVLFTGRSVRAALDQLSDFGRPSAIRLLVLVDRGGRELPIQPDYAAVSLSNVPRDHRVNVRFSETDGRDEITVEPRSPEPRGENRVEPRADSAH